MFLVGICIVFASAEAHPITQSSSSHMSRRLQIAPMNTRCFNVAGFQQADEPLPNALAARCSRLSCRETGGQGGGRDWLPERRHPELFARLGCQAGRVDRGRPCLLREVESPWTCGDLQDAEPPQRERHTSKGGRLLWVAARRKLRWRRRCGPSDASADGGTEHKAWKGIHLPHVRCFAAR